RPPHPNPLPHGLAANETFAANPWGRGGKKTVGPPTVERSPPLLTHPLGTHLMFGSFCSRPRYLTRLVPTLLAVGTLSAITVAAVLQQSVAEGMRQYAEALISSLDESQKKAMVLPYGSDTRVAWHFVPKEERKGVALGEMNDAQKAASMRLLRAALSESG